MFYPLMVDLKNKEVVIIGGGKVSLRKAKKFLEYEAVVKVVSLEVLDSFYDIENLYEGKLTIIKDEFKSEYIDTAFLVIAATSNYILNESISLICHNKNILCNIVDNINKSSFIVPSTIKRGDLNIAISTLGNSPSLCAKIRKDLEKTYDKTYEEYVELLGECRELVLENYSDEVEKKSILNSLVDLNSEELKKLKIKLLSR